MNYNLNIILIIVIFYFILKNKKESFNTDPDALTECNDKLTARKAVIKNLAIGIAKQYVPVRVFLDKNKAEFCKSFPEKFKKIAKPFDIKCPKSTTSAKKCFVIKNGKRLRYGSTARKSASEALNFKRYGYTDLKTKKQCELPENCDAICYSDKGNYNDCKKYCHTISGTINSCTFNCNTPQKDGMKNCKKYCGEYLPYFSDLPNCERACYTKKGKLSNCVSDCVSLDTQNETLKNCKYRCGTKQTPVKVELPSCINDCYTTHEKGAPNCTENCGTRRKPLKSHLHWCRNSCYTEKDTLYKPLAGTKSVHPGTGTRCRGDCCKKGDYKDRNNYDCYRPIRLRRTISKAWKDWTKEQIQRGVPKKKLEKILLKNGYNNKIISDLLTMKNKKNCSCIGGTKKYNYCDVWGNTNGGMPWCYTKDNCGEKGDSGSWMECPINIPGNNLDDNLNILFRRMGIGPDEFLNDISKSFETEFKAHWFQFPVRSSRKKNNRFYKKVKDRYDSSNVGNTHGARYTSSPKISKILNIEYFGKFTNEKGNYVENIYDHDRYTNEWNTWKKTRILSYNSYRVFNIKIYWFVGVGFDADSVRNKKQPGLLYLGDEGFTDNFLYFVPDNASGDKNDGTFGEQIFRYPQDFRLKDLLRYPLNKFKWYDDKLTFRQNWNKRVQNPKTGPSLKIRLENEPVKIMTNEKWNWKVEEFWEERWNFPNKI